MCYTIIDFETTGLDSIHDEIIQIGAVKLNHKLEQIGVIEINVRVPAGKYIPEFITELTGITPEDNQGGLVAPTAFQILKAFISHDTLVAHNAPFDLAFLYNKVKPIHEHTFYDTRAIIKMIEPDKSAKLADVTDRLGINLENHHTALADSLATAELFRHLHNKVGKSVLFDEYRNVVLQSEERPVTFLPPHGRVIELNTL